MNNQLKFCPKCGSEHFVKQSIKLHVCKSCGFNFYQNSAAAVAGIIENENNEVLFAVRKYEPAKNTLDLPGGFVDKNESVEDALKREIFEELNLKIHSLEFLTSFPNQYVYKDFLYHTVDLAFTCKTRSFDNIKAHDDVADFCFIDKEKINVDEIGLASIKKIVKYYLET